MTDSESQVEPFLCKTRDGQSGRSRLNGVRGEQRGQVSGRRGKAPFGQDAPKTVKGARHAFLRGFGGQAEPSADLLGGAPLGISDVGNRSARFSIFPETFAAKRGKAKYWPEL